MFRIFFLSTLFGLEFARFAAAADSLLDVYQLALQNDPTFRAAQASLRAGLEEQNLGRAGLLPKIDVNAGFDLNLSQSRGQFPAGGTLFPSNTDIGSETKRWGVSLQQPIFDLTAWFRFERGQELTQQAKVQFAADQQSLILRVAEAYLQVLRSRANLDASRAQEAATQRQLELSNQRFEVGLAAITDVRQAEAAHDLAVANRLADEGAEQVALQQLSVLTGRQHTQLALLKEGYPVSPPDPAKSERWVEFARLHNYDIQVADLARNAALQAARAAGAEHLPKIAANLGYSESRSENDYHNLTAVRGGRYEAFPRNNNQGSLSLTATMPLFAGGGISAGRRKAYAEYDRTSESYLGTLRNTEQSTRAEYINVMTHVARTRAGKQAVISGQSSLEANEAGYEVGTRNIIDVLNAVQTLFSASRDYANARIDYVLSKLRLQRLAGTLSPEDITSLNQWLQPPPADQENPNRSAAEIPAGPSRARDKIQ